MPFDEAFLKEERMILDYQEVFGTAAGKRVLQDLASRCGFLQPMFQGDVNRAIWNDGLRSLFLSIRTFVNTNIEERRRQYEQQQESGESG